MTDDFLTVQGGRALSGHVCVSGAKNSALPLLIATLLTEETCILSNIPDLEDIAVTLRLLQSLGAKAHFSGNRVSITCKKITSSETRYDLIKALRASFWVFGPLLARTGEARVPLPGGDAIGTRPVDLHLKGLTQMGADIRLHHGVVIGRAPGGLRAQTITLDFPSVGATHQLLMTAALVPGETVIKGAAREPEVAELCQFLSRLGAEIDGVGTATLSIRGREQLGAASAEVLGDRIEAATYLTAAAVTGGKVSVSGISADALEATLAYLSEAGCDIELSGSAIEISGPTRLRAVNFSTAPFPGLATDVQPLLMAAMTRADGTSRITETVFENRFGHVAEYRRFGASIELDGRTAIVNGLPTLSSAPVDAGDIRAAAGLVLMGLMADGRTQINETYHLDRGYEGLVDKLKALGANVTRSISFQKKELVLGC